MFSGNAGWGWTVRSRGPSPGVFSPLGRCDHSPRPPRKTPCVAPHNRPSETSRWFPLFSPHGQSLALRDTTSSSTKSLTNLGVASPPSKNAEVAEGWLRAFSPRIFFNFAGQQNRGNPLGVAQGWATRMSERNPSNHLVFHAGQYTPSPTVLQTRFTRENKDAPHP